ncbi:MAG TPA: GNAT family N-acetyltransferase [Terracidiphilus sp.]|jgi:GNAT superfamily N-acetyltransferase
MNSIRLARVEDAAAIAHVHVQSWRTTYTGLVPEQYLASLNETERASRWQEWLTLDISVFVAEIESKIVGFAGGGPLREPHAAYDAELYTIYLLEEAQRRGIGKDLLSAVAEALVRKDHTSMLVWVLEQNPAVRFYEKTGALRLISKQIEIGGVSLTELALGWPDLRHLI